MEQENLQVQIDSINKKLDIILAEIELQSRHRREMEDLKDDLMRVGKDVYDSALIEFEEVHDQLKTGDIFYLFKKLLRNINNITKTFEQLENFKGFIQDFSPVSRELFLDFMNKLNEFDKKGYFEFLREISKISDNIVTSFSAEDVKNLGNNVVTILNTVKSLTQPDMLHAINNAVSVYKNLDIDVSEKVSLFSLIKELNNPEFKKGLLFAVKFLKNIAATQEQKDKLISNK
ncbi:MAG TPA: DUF1641 domain-containing protein [Ignavibacteria bacterium]